MQMAIASEISGVERPAIAAASEESIFGAAKIMDAHGPVLKALARATYENTQDTLAASGVDKMPLFRGVEINSVLSSVSDNEQMRDAASLLDARTSVPTNGVGSRNQMAPNQGYWITDDKLEGNPISSWTSAYDTAEDFSGTSGLGKHSLLYSAVVPASSIYSTAISGPGCLIETEVIVLPLSEDIPAKVATIVGEGTQGVPVNRHTYLSMVRNSLPVQKASEEN